MQGTATLYDEYKQSLNRIERQQRLLKQHALPLIVITTHLPNELMQRSVARELFEIAMTSVLDKLQEISTRIVNREFSLQKAGNEATLVVAGLASSELKRAMIQIEKYHPLGALMNIDVITPEGKTISRSSSDMDPRPCLLCDCAASYCAANNRHSAKEIEAKVLELFDTYYTETKEAVA